MLNEKDFLKDLVKLLSATSEIEMETDLLDIDEWNSLSAMEFLTMIKNNYGVVAEPYTVAEAILVEDLYNVVKNLLG